MPAPAQPHTRCRTCGQVFSGVVDVTGRLPAAHLRPGEQHPKKRNANDPAYCSSRDYEPVGD